MIIIYVSYGCVSFFFYNFIILFLIPCFQKRKGKHLKHVLRVDIICLLLLRGQNPLPFWYSVFKGYFRPYTVRKRTVRSTQKSPDLNVHIKIIQFSTRDTMNVTYMYKVKTLTVAINILKLSIKLKTSYLWSNDCARACQKLSKTHSVLKYGRTQYTVSKWSGTQYAKGVHPHTVYLKNLTDIFIFNEFNALFTVITF